MPAETKAKAPAIAGTKEPTHWVVLHNMVGRFEKGKVIPQIQWPTGTSFTDLQRLGAIRPAEQHEVEDGVVELDPDASKEARLQEVTVLKTQIDLLEKELAFHKDESQKFKLQQAAPTNIEPSPGVQVLIKKKDAAIAELSEKLKATEAERVALAGQVDQLNQALEAATKPVIAEKPQGNEKK